MSAPRRSPISSRPAVLGPRSAARHRQGKTGDAVPLLRLRVGGLRNADRPMTLKFTYAETGWQRIPSFEPRLPRSTGASQTDDHYASRAKWPRGRHNTQGAGPTRDDRHPKRAPGVRGDGQTGPLGQYGLRVHVSGYQGPGSLRQVRCASVFPIMPLSLRKATPLRALRSLSGAALSSLLIRSMARRLSFADNPMASARWWR